jgi:hypothetical protein
MTFAAGRIVAAMESTSKLPLEIAPSPLFSLELS